MSGPLAELVLDPTWPWSLPGGLSALGAVAVTLALLTLWTYIGVRGARFGRVLTVLLLRLGALLVATLVVLRPSFADRDKATVPSKLIVLLDDSASMNINDEQAGESRWERARRLLKAPGVESLLRRLQNEQKVEIVFYQASEVVRKFDPTSKALGKRTDVGGWLHTLLKTHGGEQNLRGLVILSDGADNGTRHPALEQAARWRGVPCPVYTFALGSPTTTPKQQDIAVTAILPEPHIVPVKNKLVVKAKINAPNFEGQTVYVHLLIDGKKVGPPAKARLKHTTDNEVVVGEVRPERVGEVKVTVEVDKVEGEVTTANNKMETYVTVTAEGVSVLWVEGKKRYESTFAIRHALSRDKRFSVFYAERVKGNEKDGVLAVGKEDWFNFKDRHYDVIVIGDISGSRFAGDPKLQVFKTIREMVRDKGTGILMMGGYETFLNSDWQKYPDFTGMLPVELTEVGQSRRPVRMMPTDSGLGYVLRLSDPPKGVWERGEPLQPLEGMTNLGKPRKDATVFAIDQDTGQPVMVAGKFGEGRVLAFGGDTTWKAWRRSTEAIPLYERFWKQLVLWLAKREDAGGNVRVIPDVRRVAAGGNNQVGFTVEALGKGGQPIADAKFKVKVIGPNKEETEVAVANEGGQLRGYFWRTNEPGDYVIEATATHPDGTKVDDRPGAAKFLAYAEDLENLRPAADHEFLKKLAAAGGGTAYLGGEDKLVEFLDGLLAQPLLPSRARAEVWPDWRRTPVSDGLGDQVTALWSSGLLACFVAFVTLLCLEWWLRRRWGMV
ncbi:MAG: glutamine amidotransferase [Gemmataceae bacterium]|nr:glutamine amidotransferase [Gemmataceae bacterium]